MDSDHSEPEASEPLGEHTSTLTASGRCGDMPSESHASALECLAHKPATQSTRIGQAASGPAATLQGPGSGRVPVILSRVTAGPEMSSRVEPQPSARPNTKSGGAAHQQFSSAAAGSSDPDMDGDCTSDPEPDDQTSLGEDTGNSSGSDDETDAAEDTSWAAAGQGRSGVHEGRVRTRACAQAWAHDACGSVHQAQPPISQPGSSRHMSRRDKLRETPARTPLHPLPELAQDLHGHPQEQSHTTSESDDGDISSAPGVIRTRRQQRALQLPAASAEAAHVSKVRSGRLTRQSSMAQPEHSPVSFQTSQHPISPSGKPCPRLHRKEERNSIAGDSVAITAVPGQGTHSWPACKPLLGEQVELASHPSHPGKQPAARDATALLRRRSQRSLDSSTEAEPCSASEADSEASAVIPQHHASRSGSVPLITATDGLHIDGSAKSGDTGRLPRAPTRRRRIPPGPSRLKVSSLDEASPCAETSQPCQPGHAETELGQQTGYRPRLQAPTGAHSADPAAQPSSQVSGLAPALSMEAGLRRPQTRATQAAVCSDAGQPLPDEQHAVQLQDGMGPPSSGLLARDTAAAHSHSASDDGRTLCCCADQLVPRLTRAAEVQHHMAVDGPHIQPPQAHQLVRDEGAPVNAPEPQSQRASERLTAHQAQQPAGASPKAVLHFCKDAAAATARQEPAPSATTEVGGWRR